MAENSKICLDHSPVYKVRTLAPSFSAWPLLIELELPLTLYVLLLCVIQVHALGVGAPTGERQPLPSCSRPLLPVSDRARCVHWCGVLSRSGPAPGAADADRALDQHGHHAQGGAPPRHRPWPGEGSALSCSCSYIVAAVARLPAVRLSAWCLRWLACDPRSVLRCLLLQCRAA